MRPTLAFAGGIGTQRQPRAVRAIARGRFLPRAHDKTITSIANTSVAAI
jgi:hypothetical protein